MRISRLTRVIHYGLIFSVLFQLISAEWMLIPEPGKIAGLGVSIFYTHVWFSGWVVFILATLYAMLMTDDPDGLGLLVPWFSAKRRAAFFQAARKEVPGIFRGRLAPLERKSPLAGAIHGLGIITLLGLGLTGSYVMLGVRSDGTMSADILLFLEVHEFFGVLTWTFLAGHIFMAIYHLFLGHGQEIREIFSFKEPKEG